MTSIEYFDSKWYLKQYPDVAAAGIDPKLHFDKHGRQEGRLPCNIPSLPLEKKLWANISNCGFVLGSLTKEAESKCINGTYAAKVLVDYYLFTEQYLLAKKESDKLWENRKLAEKLFSTDELFLLRFSSLYGVGLKDDAQKVAGDPGWKSSTKLLAKSMLSASSQKLEYINQIYKKNRLKKLCSMSNVAELDSLTTSSASVSPVNMIKALLSNAKVSVIVPVFNAEKVISTCIDSLLNQTWKKLEIIVVDDASTDNSYAELTRLYGEIKHITIIKNNKNQGAYATRNIGMSIASGDYLTVMDADDWAHPQKIEKQVFPLLFNRLHQATVSCWARCTRALYFSRVRAGHSWVHRNVSSLLVRRSVLDTIGGWDQVRVNADTEFYERLLAQFGRQSVLEVLPDVPLSFGRKHKTSLTQNSETHMVTQFGGIRKAYMDFARVWHMNTEKYVNPSFLSNRPFPIPSTMYIGEQKTANEKRFRRWQTALDEGWYTTVYDDVNKMGIDLHEHFWQIGESEGRYPSALFNPAAYAYKFKLPKGTSPTWHALNSSWDFEEPVQLIGSCQHKLKTRKKIALFGHAVSSTVFGAERSLVDIATAFFNSGVEITLFLPSLNNTAYIEELQKVVKTIVFIPLIWAKGGREPLAPIVSYLEKHFKNVEYYCVYTNTITLLEPLLAAKQAHTPSVTHVRELVEYDKDLAEVLNETPRETHQRVVQSADYFIANSKETALWLSCPERTSIVYNCVNDFGIVKNAVDIPPLKICMLSSNVKKKGVDDFFKVATAFNGNTNFQFTLYGPKTHEVLKAQKRYEKAAVRVAGYIDNPRMAIESHHIILSLSSFKESFGRTVAEAMISGRVVVGYKWGAVTELLDSDSGCLVDYKNIEDIVSMLEFLMKNQQKLVRIGQAANKRAKVMFSNDAFQMNLVNSIKSMLRSEKLHDVGGN